MAVEAARIGQWIAVLCNTSSFAPLRQRLELVFGIAIRAAWQVNRPRVAAVTGGVTGV
jgi:hypothetical protein